MVPEGPQAAFGSLSFRRHLLVVLICWGMICGRARHRVLRANWDGAHRAGRSCRPSPRGLTPGTPSTRHRPRQSRPCPTARGQRGGSQTRAGAKGHGERCRAQPGPAPTGWEQRPPPSPCAMNRNPHAAATESARGSARGGARVGKPQARHPESRCRRGAMRSLQLRAPAPAPRPRCPARGASAAAERAGCSLRCAASLPGSVMIKIGCHCPNVIIPSVWPIVCQPSSREKKAQTFDEERCQK